jgi:hypothetical protein
MRKLTRRTERFRGWTLGLHRKSWQYCGLDPEGNETANTALAATPERLRRLVEDAQAQGRGGRG